MQSARIVETHNYGRSGEHCIWARPWTGTHRLCVIKCDDVAPDEVQQGGIPILQRCQPRNNTRPLQMAYSKE
jgi:hypothetical protein